jgi:hypothetical protein
MPPDEGPITIALATDSFLIGDGLASLLADAVDRTMLGPAMT